MPFTHEQVAVEHRHSVLPDRVSLDILATSQRYGLIHRSQRSRTKGKESVIRVSFLPAIHLCWNVIDTCSWIGCIEGFQVSCSHRLAPSNLACPIKSVLQIAPKIRARRVPSHGRVILLT